MTLTPHDVNAATTATSYRLDSSASRFTVRAFVGGVLSALGHSPTLAIRHFSGDIVFSPASPKDATLKMEVRSDSLEVTGNIRSTDRREMQQTMNREILQVAQYPAIAFQSAGTSVDTLGDGRYKVALNGILTLRGVSRNLPVTAQVMTSGDLLLRASGEFSILQSEYGIPQVTVAGGALRLKDELRFAFDIVARKTGLRKQGPS
jgi:polyisoprenoid-binding protein YceI